MPLAWAAAALVAAAPAEPATDPVQAPAPEVVSPAPVPEIDPSLPRQIVPEGTPVRLMVLREVTSRNSHPGDRFELRVDEPIYIDGKPVIPVGATAWGEVVTVEGNGAAGKGGKLGCRLLYVALPTGRLPLRGSIDSRGDGNGAGVVMAIVGFGILGLLNSGDSARLRGGQTFTAFADKAS